MSIKSIVNTWGLLFMIIIMSNYALREMLVDFKGLNEVIVFIGTLVFSVVLHYIKGLKS